MNKIKYITGDLFEHIKDLPQHILIPHVCNNLGKWNAGFTKSLSRNFPEAEIQYLQAKIYDRNFDLGQNILVETSKNRLIVNMIAQKDVGTAKRRLKYNCLVYCMSNIAERVCYDREYEIHAPMFGSGLSGGKWAFIEELIQDCWLDEGISVTIYRL